MDNYPVYNREFQEQMNFESLVYFYREFLLEIHKVRNANKTKMKISNSEIKTLLSNYVIESNKVGTITSRKTSLKVTNEALNYINKLKKRTSNRGLPP